MRDLEAYRGVAAACLKQVIFDYAIYYRMALLVGYKSLYLADIARMMRRCGYSVELPEQEEYEVEDLDAFFDSPVGAAVCELLDLDTRKAMEESRRYAWQLVDVSEVKREVQEEARRMWAVLSGSLLPA